MQGIIILLLPSIIMGISTYNFVKKMNDNFQGKIQTEYNAGMNINDKLIVDEKYSDHKDEIETTVDSYNRMIKEQRKEYKTKIEDQKTSYNSKISKQRKTYNGTINSNREEYKTKFSQLDEEYLKKIEDSIISGIKTGRTEKLRENEEKINKSYNKKKSKGEWNSVIMTINE